MKGAACQEGKYMERKFNLEFCERFVAGDVTTTEIIEALAEAVRTGDIVTARGYFRVTARILTDNGYIDEQGNIL